MTEWNTVELLIVDEVMTGFGRTGRMFASEHEGAMPDLMILGKRLTGGYLPLAITLSSEKLFSALGGSVADGKALAYGHSYTRNALGSTAAKASLEVFENESVLEARRHGLLTRPIGNVVVLMPPLCITTAHLSKAVEALRASMIHVSRRNDPSARKDAEKATA